MEEEGDKMRCDAMRCYAMLCYAVYLLDVYCMFGSGIAMFGVMEIGWSSNFRFSFYLDFCKYTELV